MAKHDHIQVNVSFLADPGAWQRADPLMAFIWVNQHSKSITKAISLRALFLLLDSCSYFSILKTLLGVGVSPCSISAAPRSVLVVVTRRDGFWSVAGCVISHRVRGWSGCCGPAL